MAKGTIFFDYDGTLHDTMKVYGPAFRTVYARLVSDGFMPPQDFTDAWISHWLGWTVEDMWTTFAPQLPENIWRKASHMIGEEMSKLSEKGLGELFEGIPEALQALKDEGYTLVFLSNCQTSYKDNHRRWFSLDRWISNYYCAQDYPGLAKWQIYEIAAKDCANPLPHVMVGDRFHDIEVGTKEGIPTIGCAFGFSDEGELDAATVTIKHARELPKAVDEVLQCIRI